MNLFGNKLYAPEAEAAAEDKKNAARAGEGSLVFEIEGLHDENDAAETLSLKTDTQDLPNPAELADAILAETEAAEPAPEPSAPEETPAPAEAAAAAPEEEAPAEAPAEEAPAAVPAGDTVRLPDPAEALAEGENPPKPEDGLTAVSYASMAKAMETAQKEPTGRFSRDAIDDETLLSELYALIGGPSKPKAPEPEAEKPQPVRKPAARITPETLNALPEEPEDYLEEDTVGVPGWLKGVFILLISLLLSAMTCYAVASDVIGKIF